MTNGRTVLTKLTLYSFSSIALLIAVLLPCTTADGQTQRKKTITRVFWQDLESGKLNYADLATTDKWHINRGFVQGFPELEAGKQKLGPMQQIGKTLMVSVNSAGDAGESKLAAIDSGVFEQPHGNHAHWVYSNLPQVRNMLPVTGVATKSMAINNQYFFGLSDQRFVAADPNQMMLQGNSNALRMMKGGGDGGSMAVANNGFGFATWNESEGDHAGQVDVVNLRNPNVAASSFKIGSSGISAVTANSGKVFFAHDGGLSWTSVNQAFNANQSVPTVNPVLNSELNSKPSSLINERNWVLFTANGEQPSLCMCNAAAGQPGLLKLPIPVEQGLRLSEPKTKLSLGKRYAFFFLEREDAGSELQEQLVVIELDPNRDFDFSDARVAKQIPVDASKIDGDRGHHQICFDAFGRFAVFTNPGDGLLSVMTLNDLVVRVRFRVGGVPERVVAVGAPEHFH